MIFSLENVSCVQIGQGIRTVKYGRPLYKFSAYGDKLIISTFGCNIVESIKILKFKSYNNSWFLSLLMTDYLVYDALADNGPTQVILHRFKKYNWIRKLTMKKGPINY
jgi:hypothetical protein